MTEAQELTAVLVEQGAALVGMADLAGLPEAPRRGLPVGVAVAVALDREIMRANAEGPTAAYWDEYLQVNGRIDAIAGAGVAWLQAHGYAATAQPSTLKELDWETLATPLPHKTIALLAGLGWIGKCDLLVTASHGSAIRLGVILTDAPLPPGTPVRASQCGACTACADTCPAGAVSGRLWEAGMPRADFYDAFACGHMGKRLCEERGIPGVICGRCITACPYTQRWLNA